MKNMKCLLDMDGILMDFVSAASRVHNLGDIYANPKMYGVWDFAKHTPLTPQQFWWPLGLDFWANLEPMQDAHEILELLHKYFNPDEICILSSPCLNHECVPGKLRSITKHFPQFERRFLFGPRKEFCAHPGNVLIDDGDHNVDAFEAHGGKAILVPRIWNSLFDKRHAALEHLDEQLSILLS